MAASLALACAAPALARPERALTSWPERPRAAAVALPLHTQGRWIVDARGERFKLAAVNWYGAESSAHVVAGLDRAPLAALAQRVRALGFNAVRLPWSNELFERDPPVADADLAANPALRGLRALALLDAVIDALAAEGVLVVLVNHTSAAGWCCSETDGNGLWYTARYPEASWLADWRGMAARYASRPTVLGADLRNEPRPVRHAGCPVCALCGCRRPVWGGPDPTQDWAAAAERGGDAVLAANPSWLIFVEGVDYGSDLRGARERPVRLAVRDRLVYSAHDYAWFHFGNVSDPEALARELTARWGYLLEPGHAYTAPVWLGEFGTCHDARGCVGAGDGAQGHWFTSLRMYLRAHDVDWGYWALNGTQSPGEGRSAGAEEGYGVLDASWTRPASMPLLYGLRALLEPRRGP